MPQRVRRGVYETGFIRLFLVSVYKGPFHIGECICWVSFGDTWNINPTPYKVSTSERCNGPRVGVPGAGGRGQGPQEGTDMRSRNGCLFCFSVWSRFWLLQAVWAGPTGWGWGWGGGRVGEEVCLC